MMQYVTCNKFSLFASRLKALKKAMVMVENALKPLWVLGLLLTTNV
jgi:hypothetical protein